MAATAVFSLFYVLFANILGIFPYFVKFDSPVINAIVSLITSVGASALVVLTAKKLLKDKYEIGLNSKNLKKGFLYASPVLIISVICIVFNVFVSHQSPVTNISLILIAFLSAVTAGAGEELLNRGVYANIMASKWAKTTKGVLLAAFVSALFFGLGHLANIYVVGKLTSQLTWQIIYATALGCGFAAAYIRTKNLWGCIVVHTLFDFLSLLFVTGESTQESLKTVLSAPMSTEALILNIITCIVGFGMMFFLLRPSKLEEIKKLWITEE